MLQRIFPCFAILACLCVFAPNASAQTDDGITADDIGGSTGGLDPDEAFDQVERGDTVGSTAATGQGFSELSAGNGGGAGGGLGGVGGLGGLGGGFQALGNLFGGGNFGQSQSNRPVLRTRLRSAVAGPSLAPAMVQQVVTARFQSLETRPQLQSINVRMEGRTAVLTGTVPTRSDRRMSEMLMRLEPGVSTVVNQIAVTQ
ncbi:MAG: BON domain-containing protein [Planctomycetota bacterium]